MAAFQELVQRRFQLAIIAIAVCSCCARGMAAETDRIRLLKGSETGEITEPAPLEVTLKGGKKIPVNQIKMILFDSEPPELSQARTAVTNGGFTKATQLLDKIDASKVDREFIKQDIDFYQAIIAARLALSGEGEVLDAGRKLNAFVKNYPNSYHYLDASEAMGDLLMASERYENAQKQYSELAKAPWPDYKMRAGVASGRSLQAQGKHAEAIQQFESVLSMPDDGAEAKNEKLSATLGKAVSLAESGKVDEAAGIIEKIIQDADPQQRELQARAYNALGTCYEKAKRNKEALMAFLHVDVLYSTVPEAHAEALAHLVPLWQAIGQADRARESRELLQQKYAKSKWAKEVK
jgi:tetratricopeptide (TPR) repeat protein